MLRTVLRNLTRRQLAGVVVACLTRIGLNALDLVGLALVGAVASLMSGTVIAESSPLRLVTGLLQAFGFSDAYIGLATLAVIFFTVKALASVSVNSAIGRLLAGIESTISRKLYESITSGGVEKIDTLPPEKITFALTTSVNSAIALYLNSGTLVIGESFLLASISLYLFLVNGVLFITMATFFLLVGLLMARILGRHATEIAKASHDSSLIAQSSLLDVKKNFRQIASMRRLGEFESKFMRAREDMASLHGKNSTIANLPRYITEIAVMLGACLLVAYRYWDGNAALAGPTVAVFFAGIFRVVSAMVPLQGALTQVRKSVQDGSLCIGLLSNQSLVETVNPRLLNHELDSGEVSPRPILKIRDVSYHHKNQVKPIFSDFSISIQFGEFVAIRGKSGAGKSTFADLIIGVRTPTSGTITFGGVNVLSHLPEIAYVPQTSHLMSGSVRDNLLLTTRSLEFDDDQLWSALHQVGLAMLIERLPDGLNTQLGSGGLILSGGESQRLSLARALVAKPKLLVLDEATSALDPYTDETIQRVIRSLVGLCTVIVIAHKESNIQGVDRIIEIRNGQIKAVTE